MRGSSLCLAILLAACDGPSSSSAPTPQSRDFSTSELSLNVEANSDGPYTQVFASLNHGTRRVELSEGEHLLVGPSGGALVEMTTRASDSTIAQLETTTGDLDLVLARLDGSRAVSVVHMPPGFALELPAGQVSAKMPLTLRWNVGKGDYTTGLTVSGDCLAPITRTLTQDPGMFVVQPADLVPQGQKLPCEVRASVGRGLKSADFAKELAPNGIVQTSQVRVGFFELVP